MDFDFLLLEFFEGRGVDEVFTDIVKVVVHASPAKRDILLGGLKNYMRSLDEVPDTEATDLRDRINCLVNAYA